MYWNFKPQKQQTVESSTDEWRRGETSRSIIGYDRRRQAETSTAGLLIFSVHFYTLRVLEYDNWTFKQDSLHLFTKVFYSHIQYEYSKFQANSLC